MPGELPNCICSHVPMKMFRFYPRVLCQGSSPILYVPTFPWKYFVFKKRERSKGNWKRVVYIRGGSWVHSPEVWEHPWALGWFVFSSYPKKSTRYQVWYIVLSLVSTLAWTRRDVSHCGLAIYIKKKVS